MIYQESTAHQGGCLMTINPTTHTHNKVILSIYDSTNTLAKTDNTRQVRRSVDSAIDKSVAVPFSVRRLKRFD
jgi:hypothetical protein